MHYSSLLSYVLLTPSLLSLVAGHGAIVKAVGSAGTGESSALGIDPTTPRDGTRRNPFQQDTTRFQGQRNVQAAEANGCGSTLQSGDLSIQDAAEEMLSNTGGMAQVEAGGDLTMTVHQINGDGAGPYTCMIDSTAEGTSFQALAVDTNVPGTRGNSRAKATDFPLKVTMPADLSCTGTVAGQDNVCMVRCQNPARAGPFGGCVPVQQAGAAGANATAAAKAKMSKRIVAIKGRNVDLTPF